MGQVRRAQELIQSLMNAVEETQVCWRVCLMSIAVPAACLLLACCMPGRDGVLHGCSFYFQGMTFEEAKEGKAKEEFQV